MHLTVYEFKLFELFVFNTALAGVIDPYCDIQIFFFNIRNSNHVHRL